MLYCLLVHIPSHFDARCGSSFGRHELLLFAVKVQCCDCDGCGMPSGMRKGQR